MKDPLPALLLAPLLSRSLTLVPHSFRLNRTETLATQAKNKTIVIFVFILIYSQRVVNFPCECHGASLKSLNKLANTSVFIAAEKWMVQYKYWSWWPYFSSKREPATLKTLESFS